MAETSRFHVDSTILITHLRQKQYPTILDKAQGAYGVPLASDAVVFELELGARRAGRSHEFRTYFSDIETLPLSQVIMIEAAILQVDLVRKNQAIGLLDTFIAATALHHNLPLLTLNTKHFQRVENLRLLPLP